MVFDAPLSNKMNTFLPFERCPFTKLRSLSFKSTSSVPRYVDFKSVGLMSLGDGEEEQ